MGGPLVCLCVCEIQTLRLYITSVITSEFEISKQHLIQTLNYYIICALCNVIVTTHTHIRVSAYIYWRFRHTEHISSRPNAPRIFISKVSVILFIIAFHLISPNVIRANYSTLFAHKSIYTNEIRHYIANDNDFDDVRNQIVCFRGICLFLLFFLLLLRLHLLVL